jgi:vesicle coat complex subunit
MLSRCPRLLESDFKIFFLRFNDASYIKTKKIALLLKIASEANVHFIIDELGEYVTDVSATVARQSILSIGLITGSVPASMQHALEKLLSFGELEIDYVTAGTLVAIRGKIATWILIAQCRD